MGNAEKEIKEKQSKTKHGGDSLIKKKSIVVVGMALQVSKHFRMEIPHWNFSKFLSPPGN